MVAHVRTNMKRQKVVAMSLCTLLAACSSTRSLPFEVASPAKPERFVLIIQEHPDGRATYSWQPAEHFALSTYRVRQTTRAPFSGGLSLAAWSRDCDEENRECYRKCMSRPLPPGYGSFTSPRKTGGKSEFCRKECQQAYDDCRELERLQPQEFTAVDGLTDWLKSHRNEVLVGSIIVVAGATFVVISAGAGLLVLAPVVLMASVEGQAGEAVPGRVQ